MIPHTVALLVIAGKAHRLVVVDVILTTTRLRKDMVDGDRNKVVCVGIDVNRAASIYTLEQSGSYFSAGYADASFSCKYT
jgi:hypothetical protein